VSGISDSFQRPINYLRISVTDRCNLRCTYCMPAEGITLMPHSELLTYEEIAMVVHMAAELGISKVRISGGEPLVRLGLANLVEMLAGIDGIDEVSMTTNAVLLAGHAAELKGAGLSRVNVSMDSLNRRTFERITGFDRLAEVLEGIEQARKAKLEPVKINVVVMRGVNDEELLDFALQSREGWHVRFIELMPLVSRGREALQFMPASEMSERISSLGDLEPCSAPTGVGPAKYYRLAGAEGTIGFITPVSEHFCFRCNRLRLTADGKLLPCLLSDQEVDLKTTLRSGGSPEAIKRLILEAIASKPEGHRVADGRVPQRRMMTQVGG
jgi:cyclic pyranopterin phosphate synthase